MGALCSDEYPVLRNIQNIHNAQARGHHDSPLPFPRLAETDPDHLILKRVRVFADPQKAVGAALHGGKSGKGRAGRQVLEQSEAELRYDLDKVPSADDQLTRRPISRFVRIVSLTSLTQAALALSRGCSNENTVAVPSSSYRVIVIESVVAR